MTSPDNKNSTQWKFFRLATDLDAVRENQVKIADERLERQRTANQYDKSGVWHAHAV